ncbi:MAG: NAD-dependent epimerase/dehydratase family protein [Chthoniobacteraceae bacterium]
MKRIVILGCGFVGGRAARLFAGEGWEVMGVTHSAESAERMKGEAFRVMACDIADGTALSAAKELHGADAVISAVSSGRGGEEAYRAVYLRGIRNVIERLEAGRVLFVSSTSVYAQTDGAWVTEESAAEPISPTSRILREAEEAALEDGGMVARLAGIYGPGRSVLLRKFLDGTAAIEEGGGRHINQIHADDAAGALFHITARDLGAGIYNVADDQPLTQLACYEFLSERLGLPLPPGGPVATNRKRGVTDKRVSNAKLRALGWGLNYPSFQAALERDAALLAAARAGESDDGRP